MKRLFIFTALLAGVAFHSRAQFGVAIHQSNLPFVGFNYQIGEKFLPEIRTELDSYFDNLGVELAVNYLFIRKSNFQLYSGVGGKAINFEGLMIPVGLNIYPFDYQNFGFHMELAAIQLGEESVLRGSWGIRYRFDKK